MLTPANLSASLYAFYQYDIPKMGNNTRSSVKVMWTIHAREYIVGFIFSISSLYSAPPLSVSFRSYLLNLKLISVLAFIFSLTILVLVEDLFYSNIFNL